MCVWILFLSGHCCGPSGLYCCMGSARSVVHVAAVFGCKMLGHVMVHGCGVDGGCLTICILHLLHCWTLSLTHRSAPWPNGQGIGLRSRGLQGRVLPATCFDTAKLMMQEVSIFLITIPAIAQLGEHLTVDICSNQMVPGSIPGGRISFWSKNMRSPNLYQKLHASLQLYINFIDSF